MEAFVERLIVEKEDLAEKVNGLRCFLDLSTIEKKVSEYQHTLLKKQYQVMFTYLSILEARLEDFKGDIK